MCKDYFYSDCFNLQFLKKTKGVYTVYQLRDGERVLLGTCFRDVFGDFWIFSPAKKQCRVSRAKTRVEAIRFSIGSYVAECPRYGVMPCKSCDALRFEVTSDETVL